MPLFYAIEREKDSIIKSTILGWIFGTLFFAGSCWWLTYSFTHYGGVPTWLAAILLLAITGIVGVFPAIFAAAFSIILKRFGIYGILAAPLLWTTQEFLRATLADTSWNSIAYSQAFTTHLIQTAQLGGVYLVGFWIVAFNAIIALNSRRIFDVFANKNYTEESSVANRNIIYVSLLISLLIIPFTLLPTFAGRKNVEGKNENNVVVVQANVPMSGLNEEKWLKLRQRHIELAEDAIAQLDARRENKNQPLTVIFPESPMNFSYGEDAEFRGYLGNFARRHNASVLFNSAEPNPNADNYFNSAIMINSQGAKIGAV